MRHAVLQLINSFEQGGTERQTVQLTRLLHESGRYDVHVACLSGKGPMRHEVEALGFKDIPEFPLTSFYNRNALVQLRRLARLMRAQKIDVVQTHDFYTNVFGMAAAALARVPVRIASRREMGGLRSRKQRIVERRAYNLAHAVVANAEAVRRDLIEEGVFTEKIVTIYNGLDSHRVASAPLLKRKQALISFNLPLEENRRFVTIVANLRLPVKDHPTFLRAAKLVREAIPNAGFIIAGEGELLGSMRELSAQLKLESDVFFTGRCSDVPALLSISDVCVLSSRAEGFSNSILEYMAAGRAVVTTDVGGAREAVVEGETGYIVPIGDSHKMAERIIALLGDSDMAREMGERGRRIVEQKFSCEAQLTHIEALYERLLAKARTSLSDRVEQTESLTGL
ncbi:MAG: glycosyltransferase [Acidobacteria bacterium]|nr:glycosyltransferase [Acidobacteriota bacterium]